MDSDFRDTLFNKRLKGEFKINGFRKNYKGQRKETLEKTSKQDLKIFSKSDIHYCTSAQRHCNIGTR